MKRFIFYVALTGIMTLSGCTGIPEKAPDINKSFSAEAEISIGNEKITGRLSRLSEKSWELEIAEPFALGGAVVTFGENGTKISMGGFEAAADITDGTASALKSIACAFDGAVKDGVTFENNTFSGTESFGEYTVTVDEKGIPEGISIPGERIAVSLSEWTECAEEDITVE